MLKSVESVIEALGGPTATAALAGVGLSAVSNWKARGKFPAGIFQIVSKALAHVGKRADPTLFGFKAAPVSEPAEART